MWCKVVQVEVKVCCIGRGCAGRWAGLCRHVWSCTKRGTCQWRLPAGCPWAAHRRPLAPPHTAARSAAHVWVYVRQLYAHCCSQTTSGKHPSSKLGHWHGQQHNAPRHAAEKAITSAQDGSNAQAGLAHTTAKHADHAADPHGAPHVLSDCCLVSMMQCMSTTEHGRALQSRQRHYSHRKRHYSHRQRQAVTDSDKPDSHTKPTA